jgi:hypothetical protein
MEQGSSENVGIQQDLSLMDILSMTESESYIFMVMDRQTVVKYVTFKITSLNNSDEDLRVLQIDDISDSIFYKREKV